MKCWGVTLQWIGIPSPVLQFATNVPFCPNSSLKMKETKWTHNPIPSASVCHYCTFLFQFFIKNEGNQMDTVSGKPNEMLGGTDFIYPPFILSGENWVSTLVGPWCYDLGQETLLSPYLFSPSVIKE